jgi:hypothetical protein
MQPQVVDAWLIWLLAAKAMLVYDIILEKETP